MVNSTPKCRVSAWRTAVRGCCGGAPRGPLPAVFPRLRGMRRAPRRGVAAAPRKGPAAGSAAPHRGSWGRAWAPSARRRRSQKCGSFPAFRWFWYRFHLVERSLETAALPQTPKSEQPTGDFPPLPSLSLGSIKITNEVNINFFLPLLSAQNKLHPLSPKVQRIIFQPFSQKASQ